jgi:hypothetical protein
VELHHPGIAVQVQGGQPLFELAGKGGLPRPDEAVNSMDGGQKTSSSL